MQQHDGFHWQAGCFFSERLAGNPLADTDTNTPIPPKRLQRWLGKPFDEAACLQQRLDSEQATLQDVYRLLAQTPAQQKTAMPQPPQWAQDLLTALREPRPATRLNPAEFLRNAKQPQTGFLFLLTPLLEHGIKTLEDGLDALAACGIAPFGVDTVVRGLFACLPPKLLPMIERSLVLELNVARLRETLQGETPEQRFQYFIDTLSTPGVRDPLLQEYMVLGRMAATTIRFWANNGIEFFTRLCQDWPRLQQVFFKGQEPGPLTQLKSGMGDTHRHGRSVVELRFGEHANLIYKPRSLAVEQHFQTLLAWANRKGFQPGFKPLRVLDREHYGWVEFVPYLPCTDQAQIGRFFQRQGAYLAMLYLLDANDFHAENLIASGEHPLLIDLESLFQPRLDDEFNEEDKTHAHYTLACSVLRIGLLPQIQLRDNQAVLGGGGLIDREGQMTAEPLIRAQDAGADNMALVRKHVPIPGNRNMPRLDGQKLSPARHAAAIEAGFVHCYELLLAHREELLAGTGPLAPFAACETRIILRNTSYYQKILLESFHPDFMRDGLERDRYLDRLWGGVRQYPSMAPAVRYEKLDLLDGDIPLFTTSPDSRHVWSSGGVQLPDMLRQAPYQLVRQKIAGMGPEDLRLQQWMLHSVLMSLATDQDHSHQARLQTSFPEEEATRERLIGGAEKVAARLVELAFESPARASWLGLDLVAGTHWKLDALDSDLYDGLSGIALFFACLGRHAGNPAHTALARKCMVSVEALAQQDGVWKQPVCLGMSGLGGLIYVYTHLACLWQEPALLEKALALARMSEAMLQKNPAHDLISGMAGALMPVLGLYRVSGSAEMLALSLRLGDALLASARTVAAGIAWDNGSSGNSSSGGSGGSGGSGAGSGGDNGALQSGFSHGSAGIAYALMELASVSGEARFNEAAQQALAFDRSLYCASAANWQVKAPAAEKTRQGNRATPNPDGPQPATSECRLAWCHGAPGIGLSRLQRLARGHDEQALRELQQAIETTETQGLGRNHCLCHGDLGNLELLLSASHALQDPALRARAYRHAAGVLDSIDTHGWRCGVPLARETPGLMTGLAGIGYGLLRFAFPDTVPNVLVLASPVATLQEARAAA